jgi:hypothetical protein
VPQLMVCPGLTLAKFECAHVSALIDTCEQGFDRLHVVQMSWIRSGHFYPRRWSDSRCSTGAKCTTSSS